MSHYIIKLNIWINYDLAILFFIVCPRKTFANVYQKMFTLLSIAAQYKTRKKNWKLTKCPMDRIMVNNLQFVHAMGYFIVGKMNELLPDTISRIKKRTL